MAILAIEFNKIRYIVLHILSQTGLPFLKVGFMWAIINKLFFHRTFIVYLGGKRWLFLGIIGSSLSFFFRPGEVKSGTTKESVSICKCEIRYGTVIIIFITLTDSTVEWKRFMHLRTIHGLLYISLLLRLLNRKIENVSFQE